MKCLYPAFKKNIESHRLISPDDTIILAFSGGKDSVTLFHLLKELSQEIKFTLKAAYFNHRIRTDSNEEEKWIQNFCHSNGVHLILGSKDVLAFKTRSKLNLENAASLSRYDFFQKISLKYKNSKIATAHTRSDLTETFFIKLFRGSGLQGLSSIYSKKKNTIIRPLLLFTQGEILAFLERNDIQFYRDYTNEEEEFLRNKIRKHVVPQIQKIEPNINDHIFRTVSIIQEEYDYFSQRATEIFKKAIILEKILPANVLQNKHLALQRHIVREYIRHIKGNLLNIDFVHIEGVRLNNKNQRGLAIPGIEFKFHKGYIFPSDLAIPSYIYTLTSPGILKIPEINTRVTVQKATIYKKPENNNQIIVPSRLIVFPLTIRNPQKTDKYIKINTSANQRVFEMIRATGLPSEIRNLCPVTVNGDKEIIWVKNSPVADRFKVKNKKAKEFIKISVIYP